MMSKNDRVELYLIRHADAGNPEEWTRPDAERPLSPKGQRQAERTGRWLAAIKFEPDAILSSPKVRAAETAQAVADALGRTITTDERLAGPIDVRVLEAILADAGAPKRPVIVGHDPDFSELLAVLVGAPQLPMRKGALARVDFEPTVERTIEPGSGVLRWLVPPDAVSRG
jgi:phosphohistidine phosphatase